MPESQSSRPGHPGLVRIIIILQSVLLLGHFFVYQTWKFSPDGGEIAGLPWVKLALVILSVSFVPASFLAFRYTHTAVRLLYRVTAIWTGFLSFLFFASLASWIVFGVARLAGISLDFHRMVEWLFGAAVLAGLYAVVNARWTRITRKTVQLAHLPTAWRGRTIALISDLHLGPIRDGSFVRRMVRLIRREAPDAVFIGGDLFDGTAIDAMRAAEPLRELQAPQGVYFVAGNHEQFGDDRKYLDAISAANVRVLQNEKLEVDGMQIVGVPYRAAIHLASLLEGLEIDRNRSSILLIHAPDHPQIAEAAGISLQLSGHTHLGQFLPWSWMARRVYRQFVYGLSRIGNLQVYTSSGAGSWGPPLRLGSISEIVVLQLE